MSLNPALQFDETSLTSAEFDPQDKVLPNSTVESNDVNAIALRALRRTAYLRASLISEAIVPYQTTYSAAYPTPIDTQSSATYVDFGMHQDVASCKVGDILDISICGTWQLNSPSAATTIGQMRILVSDDYGGTPTDTALSGAIAIVEQSTGVSATMSFCVRTKHVVQEVGTSRARVQCRYNDLLGGAGTATLLMLFESRIDVIRYRMS